LGKDNGKPQKIQNGWLKPIVVNVTGNSTILKAGEQKGILGGFVAEGPSAGTFREMEIGHSLGD
jgi:hypothetical protein